MTGLFDTHTQLLHKALDLGSRRNAILSSNLANVETPGYKAKDLVFERALDQAMKARIPGPLQTTDARHLDGRMRIPLAQVKGESIRAYNPVPGQDDNSVDLEKESVKLAENQLLYQGLTRMIGHKFSVLRHAIQEG